jgi:ribosomal protein S18 acetylase RimI-like enzyme
LPNAATLESKRFGRKVERFTFDSIDTAAISALAAAAPDLAIVHVDCSDIDKVYQLGVFGATPIVADTLVSYGIDLDGRDARPLRNQLNFRVATTVDKPALDDLVQTVFNSYKNHYRANPTLTQRDILAGYVEWAASFLDGGNGREAWLACQGDSIVGFANCETRGGVYHGVLYGVHPKFGGRGIYGDLIAHTMAEASHRGLRRMEVSTQIDNMAVQASWVGQGMRLFKARNTVHLNLFLSDEYVLAEHSRAVVVTPELVESLVDRTAAPNRVTDFDRAKSSDWGTDLDPMAGRGTDFPEALVLDALISAQLATDFAGARCRARTSSYFGHLHLGDRVSIRLLVKHQDRATGERIVSTRVHANQTENNSMIYCGQAVLSGGDT